MKIYVKTPARLHLGLIDMNGDLGRIFGGLGVGIEYPNVVLETQKSSSFIFTGEKEELTREIATRFLDACRLTEKVAIRVIEVIPEHVGLGSGTQLALAVSSSIANLFNVKATPYEFAATMGRTAQSGVGTAVFAHGGLVVEAGKNTQDPNRKIIPPICRLPFPSDWRFVVAIPKSKKGLANEAEASAFENLPPMPEEHVGKICRLLIMKLLPAVIEKEIRSFGEALTEIQRIVGDNFAEAQGGRFASSLARECVEFMLSNGACGSGQSSWGPTVYGVIHCNNAKNLELKTKRFLKTNADGGDVFISKVKNRGAIIKVIR